jgi:hypothetical protein
VGVGARSLHSHVTPVGYKTYCTYYWPTPGVICRLAGDNRLPVDGITEVRVPVVDQA